MSRSKTPTKKIQEVKENKHYHCGRQIVQEYIYFIIHIIKQQVLMTTMLIGVIWEFIDIMNI